jgi:hypothetical protein
MAEIIKPSMANLWASGGAVVAPSAAKIDLGWTAEIPPHQYQNWHQNRSDNAIGYMFQHGIPEWDSSTEYFASKSYVQEGGVIYRASTNNTNTQPSINPTDWVGLMELVAPPVGMQVFSNPGVDIFNRPVGKNKVKVRVWGAGGGGASDVSATPGPSGGGEGGYWEGIFDLSSSPTVSVTVGTGGNGAASIGNNGVAGTASSFGAFCSAQGGAGGLRVSNSPGGGTATGVSGFGWRGGYGLTAVSSGATFYGGAGGGAWSPFALVDPSRPEKRGAGGGGRINSAGAPGAHGLVVVEW